MLSRLLRLLLVTSTALALPSTGHRGWGPGPLLVPLERRDVRVTPTSSDGEWLHHSRVVLMPSWQALQTHAAASLSVIEPLPCISDPQPTRFTYPHTFHRSDDPPPPLPSLYDNQSSPHPLPLTSYYSSASQRTPSSASTGSSSPSLFVIADELPRALPSPPACLPSFLCSDYAAAVACTRGQAYKHQMTLGLRSHHALSPALSAAAVECCQSGAHRHSSSALPRGLRHRLCRHVGVQRPHYPEAALPPLLRRLRLVHLPAVHHPLEHPLRQGQRQRRPLRRHRRRSQPHRLAAALR